MFVGDANTRVGAMPIKPYPRSQRDDMFVISWAKKDPFSGLNRRSLSHLYLTGFSTAPHWLSCPDIASVRQSRDAEFEILQMNLFHTCGQGKQSDEGPGAVVRVW